MEREYLSQSAKLRRSQEEQAGAVSEALSIRLQEVKTEQLQARAAMERHHDLRKTHIHRAQERVRAAELQQIEGLEGKRKFEVQRAQLDATRERDAGLQAERDRFEAFRQVLAGECDALAAFEARVMASLSGYPAFQQRLQGATARPPSAAAQDENEGLDRFRTRLADAGKALKRVRRSLPAAVFRVIPIWVLMGLLIAIHAAAVPAANQLGLDGVTWMATGISLVISGMLVIGFHLLGGRLAAPAVADLVEVLEETRGLYDDCSAASERHHEQNLAALEQGYRTAEARLNREWKDSIKLGAEKRVQSEIALKERLNRCLARNGQLRQMKLKQLEATFEAELNRVHQTAAADHGSVASDQTGALAAIEARHVSDWAALEQDWRGQTQSWRERVDALQQSAAGRFPGWDAEWMKAWQPPTAFNGAVRFGQARVDLAGLAGAVPQDNRLALPFGPALDLPLCLAFPGQGSLVVESAEVGREQAVDALNNIVIRLLASAPPGRLQFTLLDPVELGQSFAGVMHLADYEDRLITSRIWTQPAQIEEQLGRLNEHIEKVAQMYLRNEYESIEQYNAQAGRIAEKYHVLVIADFPTNFSDLAARRLQSILASGPRCGVFTLIHRDARRPTPSDLPVEDLEQHCLRIRIGRHGVFLGGDPIDGVTVTLDAPPAPEWVTPLLHRIGQASVDSNRVEVPFHDVTPPEDKVWSLETTTELRVPVGRTGATKLQYFALGKGTQQHALVAGKTGSGKSTLFHVLITNLALWCDPRQVEFYLVDFKKGVEFKCYARHHLPHARVVAIESDREFGLSVLERVDEELKRRGEMFRKLGAQNIAGYKEAGGTEPIPRTLLLIDEFQEFFTEDDHVSQNAALLLDRIVRQGRAFGIHVVLGSQTLGGAYTLARATLGQMVVRVALQCNEADAYLIMDEENPAPRLLTRPGEAIYNDAAGALEGNSPFQIVWLPDRERDEQLARVAGRVADRFAPGDLSPPVIFEGNAPADVSENVVLTALLAAASPASAGRARAFLGAPNSIKGPTEAVFSRQAGQHLLVVGQRSEAALAMLGVSLVSLAAAHGRNGARFIVLDGNAPDSVARRFLEQVAEAVPQDIRLVQPNDVDAVMAEMAAELEARTNQSHGAGAPPLFVLVHEVPKFRKLKYEEDFAFSLDESEASGNPGVRFNNLILEGASLGMHVIATCDTANNLNRALSRKAIAEFEMRVLFQMNANDSAALIDSPKAGELGLHRAILHNGAQGWMETFRPYSLPDPAWIEEAARQLKRLAG